MTRSILLSPSEAESGLTRELVSLGVRVVHWPRLSIDEAQDNFQLDDAIDNLFGYDWLIFKSAAAAQFFLRRFERNHQTHELDNLKILAVGERTQQALTQAQIHVDVMVDRSTDVLAALESYAGDISVLNLLVPSANMGGAVFELQLADAAVRVDSVLSYRTCSSPNELVKLKALITGGAIDFVAFTNPRSVDELAALFDTDDLARTLPGVAIAGLDESTRQAARGYGVIDLLMPAESSVTALARLIPE